MYNKKMRQQTKKLANLFRTMGQAARFRIILAIGEGEACVCHLEAALGYRQAYISQHLMALREAGILQTRRDGRFIFYRLRDVQVLALIRLAGEIAGEKIQFPGQTNDSLASCVCPRCDAEVTAGIIENVGVS